MQGKEAKLLGGEKFFQYKDRRSFNRKGNLHRLMVAEAESVVRYNWSDVVYSDKEDLKKMPNGGVAVWCIYEMGSYFCPLYQPVSPRPTKIRLPLICHVICRFYPLQADALSRSIAKTARYYIIRKSGPGLNGSLEPIHLVDLRNFIQLMA